MGLEFRERRVVENDSKLEYPRCSNCGKIFPLEGPPEGICPRCGFKKTSSLPLSSKKDTTIRGSKSLDPGIQALYDQIHEDFGKAYDKNGVEIQAAATDGILHSDSKHKSQIKTYLELLLARLKLCKVKEIQLWQLLSDDKKGDLADEHQKLFDWIVSIRTQLIEFQFDIRHFEHWSADNIIKQLVEIERLLTIQIKELSNIVQLPHNQIVEVLNGNKGDQHISEISQKLNSLYDLVVNEIKSLNL